MGKDGARFAERFGSETRCNAELVFEWSGWALESLDKTREDTRHGHLDLVGIGNRDLSEKQFDRIDKVCSVVRLCAWRHRHLCIRQPHYLS